MKYLLILSAILLIGCSTKGEFVIGSMTKTERDGTYVYIISTEGDTRGFTLLTDSLYSVGDTLVLRRK